MNVIDMHNHFIAPEVIDFLAREGKHFATRIVERDGRRFFLIQEKAMRPIDGPISNAQARIADMEREGVDAQAVSCVPFLMYPDVEADRALAIAQVNNDAMVALGAGDRGHFVPLASVPMQDPAAAAKELERAAKLGTSRRRDSAEGRRTSARRAWISRCSGKRPRRCGWSFASILLKPRRLERLADIFSATWSAIFTTPASPRRC